MESKRKNIYVYQYWYPVFLTYILPKTITTFHMGNTQADLKTEDLKTSTPDSIKCKEELESIKHTLDNLDGIAEQNSNLNLTAEQLFTYKKKIDDQEEQLNSLTERHSISERSDVTNLYENQVELFRHVYKLS